MIYAWTGELYNDDNNLEKEIKLLKEVIDNLSYPGCEEDTEKYRRSLDKFERRTRELEAQSRILKRYEENIFITIAGTNFYNNPKFERKMKFTLKMEPENEYDRNAIAVYHNGEKVGYVADSDSTNADITAQSRLLKSLPDTMQAEYLFQYRHKYYIATILKDD